MKRLIRSILIVAFGILGAGLDGQGSRGEEIGGYLFAHMTKDDYGHLYYSLSEDGFHWTMINDGRRVSEGYRGHPDICRGHDGRYYQVGVEEETQRLVLWASADLLDWEMEKILPEELFARTPGHRPNRSWWGAPKTFYDASTGKYLISWHVPAEGISKERFEEYWCSMRTWFVTTENFLDFTEPARLFPFEMGTIDVIIRKEGELYVAIIKDECEATAQWTTGKSIRVCVSRKPEGPYSYPGDKISPGYREAPTVIPLAEGGWLMYYEQYPGVQYEAVASPSLQGPWYNVYGERISLPEGARHGCMIPLSRQQFLSIATKYGNRVP